MASTSPSTTSISNSTAAQVARLAAKAQAANKYLASRGYEMLQRNGQRISVSQVGKGIKENQQKDEIFIGKLPRDMFEDELLPALERAGRVYKCRLMMDFSGTNRGYAFARYVTPEEANNACAMLHNRVIRPNSPPIGVIISFDNRRLFFGNLPVQCTKKKLSKELHQILEGVEDVHMPDRAPGCDKRIAFVTFKTHEAATQARRVLLPGDVKMFDRVIKVDWAQPCRNGQSLQAKGPAPSVDHNNNNLIDLQATSGMASLSSPSPVIQPVARLPLLGRQALKEQISNHQLAPLQLQHQQENHVLGSTAQQLLDLCPVLQPPQPSSQTSTISTNRLAPCTITIGNLNPARVDLQKLKCIFELAGRFRVLAIMPAGYSCLTITYETSEHADLMLEALTSYPTCFQQLALPGHTIVAYRGL